MIKLTKPLIILPAKKPPITIRVPNNKALILIILFLYPPLSSVGLFASGEELFDRTPNVAIKLVDAFA